MAIMISISSLSTAIVGLPDPDVGIMVVRAAVKRHEAHTGRAALEESTRFGHAGALVVDPIHHYAGCAAQVRSEDRSQNRTAR
jgi:hypothetical protein